MQPQSRGGQAIRRFREADNQRLHVPVLPPHHNQNHGAGCVFNPIILYAMQNHTFYNKLQMRQSAIANIGAL